MKAGVIGAGAWGTALAITALRSGADVVLWSYDGGCKSFEDVDMTDALNITGEASSLSDCDVWLIVTPSSYFRDTVRDFRRFYNGQPIIVCTKGAESSTGQFMSDVLEAELPECNDYGVLSGPQFASEVAKGVKTGSTLAGTVNARRAGQQVLNNLFLQESDDVIGAEICGVGKNAVALICGYNSLKAGGENHRALIFTQAWGEVVSVGLARGAQLKTFLGLCGIGDLFLSATSSTSRNYAGGVAIASGQPPVGTVEGIFALNGLIHMAQSLGIDVPVLKEMKTKLGV